RMAKNEKERRDQKYDRLNVVAEKRNPLNGDLEPPMDELPESLNVIGEVERSIFEVRPAGVGGPGAEAEKGQREAEDRSFTSRGERLRRGHYPCPYPRSR